MVVRVNTVSFQGIEVRSVDVQVQLSNGLPAFNIVGYLRHTVFLSCFFMVLTCFFVKESLALSCFPAIPDTIYILKAPVIFNGKVTEFIEHKDDNGKIIYKDIRFKVIEMYKGPVSDTIDIRSISIMGYLPNLAVGSEVTIIPDVMENGALGISYCSIGFRNQRFWEWKVKKAYSTEYPMLYLIGYSVKNTMLRLVSFIPEKDKVFPWMANNILALFGIFGVIVLLFFQFRKFLFKRKRN